MQRYQQRMDNRQQPSKGQQHRRTLYEDDEENSSSADEDIYDRIAILAKEYGEEYEDDEEEENSSLTMRRNYPKHKNIPEDTPTSETNDPFSEDDKEDSEDQQEIQMKVQTRKALKDSKKFLHTTTRKMENKMNISHNQSVLSNALSKEKNDLYEATINQITSKDNWILSTSFDKCFEKIRKQVMSDVYSREKSKNRPMETYSRKPVVRTSQTSKGKTIEKKPVMQLVTNYDDKPLPTNNRRNYDDIPIRQPKQQEQQPIESKEPPKKKQQEQAPIPTTQKDKSRRQSKQKHISIEPYEATESELNALEGFFGSKKTLKIVSVGSVFVRVQKFWRANRKYNRNKAVLDLREMWRTTVFEMERAQYDHLDTSEYKRQLKYFAAQFCKEMHPQKPFTPGGKKPSSKDKHTFLHRKQQPAFLKNVNNKRSHSKSSTPATPPDTPTQPTPTNISPPSNAFSTPLRSPPTRPKEEIEFTPPISQSPRKDPQQKRPVASNDETQFTTPKKSNGMRRSLSSRVFRLETRANIENTPLSEQEATPFKEGPELNLTSNSDSTSIQPLQQTPNNMKSSPRNSPRKMTQKQVSSPNTTLNQSENNTTIMSEEKQPNNSVLSTPTKSVTNEISQNTSLNNITVSPIMRKAPPPPIEVKFLNSNDNEQEDPYEEDDEMEGYNDNHENDYSEHSDSLIEDNQFDNEDSELIEELEQSSTPERSTETKKAEETSASLNRAEENTNNNSSSLNNNIERFSLTYREEEVKKKAEALYNRTTGTLSDLLSPRGRQSTEIVQPVPSKQPEEEPKQSEVKSVERILVEETNLSISSHGSSVEKVPKPPSRKPPQPTLSLEESMERDRTRFAELENLCFSVDESSIIYQFDKEFVYNGLQ